MSRQLTQAGLDLIKSFETDQPIGMLPTPNDVPTAGWGHTGHDVRIGVFYPPEVRQAWLVADTAAACAEVCRDVTVPLTDDEFDALVCLIFNIGRGAFRGSTLLKKLDAGDYQGAARQFLVWNKQAGKELAGLDRRRAAEEALFETPDPGV
jgi:lysozyme